MFEDPALLASSFIRTTAASPKLGRFAAASEITTAKQYFVPGIGQRGLSHHISLGARHPEQGVVGDLGIVLSFNSSHNLTPAVGNYEESLDLEANNIASKAISVEFSLQDFLDVLKAAVITVTPEYSTNELDNLRSPPSTQETYLFDRRKSLEGRITHPVDANTSGQERYPVSRSRAIDLSGNIFGHGKSICSAVYCFETVSTIQFLEDIAWSYYNAGRNREALGVYQSLIDIGSRTGYPITEYLYRMSKTLEGLGHYDQALSMYQHTWIRFKAEGCNDTTLGTHALKSMGFILCKKHQYSQAIGLYKQALLLEVHKLGPEHPDIVSTLAYLAGAYGSLRRYTKCVHLSQLALALIRRTGFANDEELANIHYNIALALAGRGKECFAEARRHLGRSYRIYLRIFGPEHQRTQGAVSLLHSVGRQAGLQRSCCGPRIFRRQRYRTRRSSGY